MTGPFVRLSRRIPIVFAMLLGAIFALAPIGATPAQAVGLDKRLCDNSANAANPANFGSTWCNQAPNAANPPVTNIQPYVPYYYVIKLSGLSTGSSKTINEKFPIEFTRVSIACYQIISGSASVLPVTGLSPAMPTPASAPAASPPQSWTVGPTTGGLTDDVLCLVKGFFLNPFAMTTVPTIDGDNLANIDGVWSGSQWTGGQSKDWNADIANIRPALNIVKTIVTPTSGLNISSGSGVVTYKIVISSANEYYFGNYLELVDAFSLTPTSVPLAVKYVAGSASCVSVPPGPASSSNPGGTDCFAAIPVVTPTTGLALVTPGYTDHLRWKFPPNSLGHIAAGGTITLTFQVKVSTTCLSYLRAPAGNNLLNRALLDEVGTANPPLVPTSANNIVQLGIDTGALQIDPNYCLNVNPTAPPGVIHVVKKQIFPATGTAANWTPGQTGVVYSFRVTNTATSGTAVTNIDVGDIVEELPGTPPFQARAALVGCLSSNPGLCGPFPTSWGPQGLIGYFDQKKIWHYSPTYKIPSLAPGQWVEFRMAVEYRQNNCVSATAMQPLYIRNFANIGYTKTVTLSDGTVVQNYPYSDSSHVDTLMSKLPVCAFRTQKAFLSRTYLGNPAAGNKIVFETTSLSNPTNYVTYRLTFRNVGTIARNIGSLFDSVSLVQNNYANALNFSYAFKCVPTTGVGGFKALSPWTTATTQYAASPANGARIDFIDHTGSNLWATFPGSSALTCDVSIAVARPPLSNSFCFSNGQPALNDLALMDVSALYPSNMTWPNSNRYSNWDVIQSSLPRCYNILVNKTASPTNLLPSSPGPIVYTVQVKDLEYPNSGLSYASSNGFSGTTWGNWNGLRLTDLFRSAPLGTNVPAALTSATLTGPDPCAQSTVPCTWAAQVGNNPSKLIIRSFDNSSGTDGILNFVYTVPAPYSPDLIVNDIAVEMAGTAAQDWYPKNPNTNPTSNAECANHPNLAACATANVAVGGGLNITKVIDPGPHPIVLNPAIQFPVTVNCTRPASPTLPANTFAANASVTAGGTTTVQGIWIGSVCTVSETPDPAALPAGCTWNHPVVTYPNGGSDVAVGSTVVPYQPPSWSPTVAITNSYTCPPPVIVSIVKSADNYSVGVGDTIAFTLHVTNNGTGTITSPTVVNVSDTLPPGMTAVFAQSNADWNCGAWPPTCTYVGGPLAPGASALPITIVAQGTTVGTWQNCASVSVTGAIQGAGGGVESCVTVIVHKSTNCCCDSGLNQCVVHITDAVCVTLGELLWTALLGLLFAILWVLVCICMQIKGLRRSRGDP